MKKSLIVRNMRGGDLPDFVGGGGHELLPRFFFDERPIGHPKERRQRINARIDS